MSLDPKDPFNAAQGRYMVHLEASAEQRHMYDKYENLEFTFGDCHVPEAVASGERAANLELFVHWHGGANYTGGRSEAWREDQLKLILKDDQIMIEPLYPLMPEANGHDIAAFVGSFLASYHDGRFLSQLKEKLPSMEIQAFERIFCSCVSAGAFSAIRFVFTAMELSIEVTGCLMISPMLNDYQRSIGHKYGNQVLTREEHTEWAWEMLQATADRRLLRQEFVFSREAPSYMGIYPLTVMGTLISVNESEPEWKSFWYITCGARSAMAIVEDQLGRNPSRLSLAKPQHTITIPATSVANRLGGNRMKVLGFTLSQDEGYLVHNTLERLPATPSSWPRTYIAHGTEDVNCAMAEVTLFFDLLIELIPGAEICLFKYNGMGHAFHYSHTTALRPLLQLIEPKDQSSINLEKEMPHITVQRSPAFRTEPKAFL